MPKYRAFAEVIGSKVLGEVEAKDEQSAIEAAGMLDSASSVNLCHQCADECDDAQIGEITVEEIE